jgi:hypothetical protein
VAITHATILRDLTELVTALDRRVPHTDRAAEAAIAHEAAALKAVALKRIDALKQPAR